ncbi:PAS domain-containing sensor histidine kinase, partial [bacterium]|nr:PAS domain-containing sensor histidine kinase [bacterium]
TDQQVAVLNILEDVEEEKRRAIVSEKRFEDIAKSSSDWIWEIDAQGQYTYVTDSVEKVLGYKSSEVIGKTPFDLMDEKEAQRVSEEFKKIVQKKLPIKDLVNLSIHKDGSKIYLQTNGMPIIGKDGSFLGYRGVDKDITREYQIDKAKTEFVSLASHQLRTPLSSINWYAEMLLAGDAGELNREQKGYLEEIYFGNQRMVKLVNALLNVSRLELGTFMVRPKLVNICYLADIVIKELQPRIKARNIKFIKKYDSQLPKIRVDVELMTMIFQNLLSNAVKYTPARGKVSLIIKKKNRKFIIKVSDNGYGIPRSQQDRVFSKLFRADNIKEKDTEGTGLGLYIIKSIVDNVQGKISFKSKLNKGTTFLVEMPLSGMKKKAGTKKLG